MNNTTKTISALAIAGMIAGLTTSTAVAAEPGILAKGKNVVAEDSCNAKDKCNSGDDCKGKDECKAKDSCKGEASCSGSDKCNGKDGCSGEE
ncbi:MAG: hypothetical protein KDD70_17045 [Bdellovibrionales bacterium]|nr:hypothetical protein [Bdellovibrionales bacterium]